MQITLDEIYRQFGVLQIERNAAVAESTRLEEQLKLAETVLGKLARETKEKESAAKAAPVEEKKEIAASVD